MPRGVSPWVSTHAQEVKSEEVEVKSKEYGVRKKKGFAVSASFASHIFLLKLLGQAPSHYPYFLKEYRS